MTKKKAAAGPRIAPQKPWPLAKIVPHPRNARTHPPAQVTLLAALLKRWGADQPIVVDEDGVILKGHGRRLAALEAGMKTFPVVQRFGLPEAEKEAMRIADNQVALLAGWDNALVASSVATLKLAGYPLDILGFGDAQLVQFTTTPGPPSQFPEFGENIKTEHECPQCHYRWSGSSASPAPAPETPAKEKKAREKKAKK